MSVESLPTPDFLERDPAVITQAVIDQFEEATGRVLQPAQVERLLIDILAYRETQVRVSIQEAALQNLVAFARYPMLDFLGEVVGTVRLAATPAIATLRFTLSGVQAAPVTVPAGTRVQSTDGVVIFATDEELIVPAGSTFGDIAATAAAAGVIGNSYAIGTISVILDPRALVATASNLAITSGGTETEDDDRYRERIRQAPNQFSTAGSIGAYRYHALSVSSEVLEVSVTSPAAGVVRLYVISTSGLPSVGLLADIAAALSAEDVRPLTDTVEVVAPAEVEYEIEATVRLLVGVNTEATLEAVEAAAEAYAEDRRSGLGRDIVPSQLIAALSVPGVYQVTLTTPAALVVVTEAQWANCTDITITEGEPGGG